MTETSGVNRTHRAFIDHLWHKLEVAAKPDGGQNLLITGAPDSLDHSEDWISGEISLDALDGLEESFGAESLDSLVMIDQLGSMVDPADFFDQAQRCLKPGGRLVMIEPGLSLLSWPCYYLSGRGRVDISQPPLENTGDRDGSKTNLATASHLTHFLEYRIAFNEQFRQLHFIHEEWLSILSGPLSRGIANFPLMPESFLHPILALEHSLMPFIGRWSASRLLIVLEKRSPSS